MGRPVSPRTIPFCHPFRDVPQTTFSVTLPFSWYPPCLLAPQPWVEILSLSLFPDTVIYLSVIYFMEKKNIQIKLVPTAVAKWAFRKSLHVIFVLCGSLWKVCKDRLTLHQGFRDFMGFWPCMLDLRQFSNYTSTNVFLHSNHLSLLSRLSDHCELAALKWAQGKPIIY